MLPFQRTTEWKWKKAKMINKYLDLARELKIMEREDDRDTNWSWYAWNGP